MKSPLMPSNRPPSGAPILGASVPDGEERNTRGARYQFTIGQLLGVVALAAILSFGCVQNPWYGLACTISSVGFVIDRLRGGAGIVGAMTFGMLGYSAYGLVLEPSGLRPSDVVWFYGGFGWYSGAISGLGAWAVLALCRLAGEAWARFSPVWSRRADVEGRRD